MAEFISRLPAQGSESQIQEPPAWDEIKSSDEYKGLSYPEQLNLAKQWGDETKAYASTLPEYSPEQDAQIDEFVGTKAVDVPTDVRMAAGAAGLVKGAAAGMGAIIGGATGLLTGPAAPVAVPALGIAGAIGMEKLAEKGLETFTPKALEAQKYAPTEAKIGQIAPEILTAGVGGYGLVKAGKTLFSELGARKAAEELGKAVGKGAAVGAGIGTVARAVTGGEITPGTVATDALLGALYTGLGSGSRVKGYSRDEAISLNERVKSGKATEAEFRDWNGILAEAQRTQARGVAMARRTEVELGGRRVLDKTELTLGEQPQVTPQPTSELPAPRPVVPELPEAGVRGIVRGTQADTAAMQRRGIITPMQESLVDLNDPVPRTNVFTTESQGINREAIIPDTRGLQGEIVREGLIVTPRTQLPSGERLALPAEGEPRPRTAALKAAKVIELEKGMEERIRQSPQGQRALRKDLEAVAVKEEKPIVETSYSDPGQQYLEWQKNINKSGVKYLAASDYDENKNWEKEGGIKIDNSYYSTIVSGDTRIAVSSSGLYLRRGKVSQSYEADIDKNGNQIYTVERIVTDPTKRGTGSASNALKKLTDIADKSNVTLQLEPATVESLSGKGQKSLTFQQLGDWYKRNGFVPKFEGSNSVLIREPKQAVSKTTIPRPMRGKTGEAGFLITDPSENIRKFTQKWATSTGLLPKEAFNILEAREPRVQAMQKQIDFTMRDLGNAAIKSNGKRVITDSQKAIIDSYLRGESGVLSELPEPMQAPVMQMRRQLDNLSERLVEAGVFTEEKADIVMGRRGEYLTRSYEKFDNPKFSFDLLQQRNPQRLEAAIKFLEDQITSNNPGISKSDARNQAIGRAREISTAEEGFSLDSLVNATNLGKDLSITKGRKNIPEEIRFLLGEYEDPIVNYARTAVKMINLLQSQRTLVDLRNWGVQNKLFFDKPTGEASQIIAAEGSKTLEPLNGLYATPELVNAIKDFDVMVKGGDLYRAFSAVNAWVKWGKTVGSVQAQFRNPLSNIVIEIMNGNFAFTGNRQALKTVLSEFGVPSVDSAEMRRYATRATQLGILDTTVLNEFYQTLKDAQAYKGDTMGFAEELSGQSMNAAKKGIQVLNKTYRAGDNFFKIMAWESEIKALMRGKGLSRQDAEVEAAERVKNTRPTYSRVFRAVKRWRNQPLFGNFMSWPSEILRTTANSVRYSAQDMKDPGMRFHGAKRIIGLITGIAIGTGIAKAFQWATDFNDRKLDAMRRFVAPYQKNATLAPTGVNEKGEIGYIDISYTDPLEVFKGPIIAAASGRDPEESLLNSTREFLEAYLGPSILINSLASAIYGKTPQNREIRNPQDPALDQLADTVGYVLRQNEPATVSQMRRVYYALTGNPDITVSKYGRIYKPSEELSAVFGIRPQSINLSKAFESKAARFNTAISDISRIFTETYGAAGKVPEEDIRKQYSKMDARRRSLFDEANKDFHAAMLLGMTQGEAVASMIAGGMSRQNAFAIANNRYRDYAISRSMQQQMRKTLTPEEAQRREDVRRSIEMGVE
jgi:hypothetical protein